MTEIESKPRKKSKASKQKAKQALAPGVPPTFGGASSLNVLGTGVSDSFSNNSFTNNSFSTHSPSSTPVSRQGGSHQQGGGGNNKPPGMSQLQPIQGPVLPSLNLGGGSNKPKVIDTSILDSDDYFGKGRDSQWGIPAAKPRAPETLSGPPIPQPPGIGAGGGSASARQTPRSLPSMPSFSGGANKLPPNMSLLDAERPKGLAQVAGGQAGNVVDYNLLLSNPLKPAFQGLGKQTAFDSLLTPRQQ